MGTGRCLTMGVFQGSVESGWLADAIGRFTVITYGLSPSLPGVATLIDTIGGEEVLYITGQGGQRAAS